MRLQARLWVIRWVLKEGKGTLILRKDKAKQTVDSIVAWNEAVILIR